MVGTFHITGSFTLTGRGLVVVGDLTKGKVKVGNFLKFQAGGEMASLKIGGMDMGRSTSRETDFVGLTFGYQNDEERNRFMSFRLAEQDAHISDQMNTE